jgi:cysteine-rich repeat protein
MRQHITIACVGIAAAIAFVGQAWASDIGIAGTKYIVIDKGNGTLKTVFVSKDPAVDKHSEDVNDVSVTFHGGYGGAEGFANQTFDIPGGESVDKGPGWLVNKATVAKFGNKSAPGGPTGVKVATIKPAKVLKLVGKTIGDGGFDLDMVGAGEPTGSVYTTYEVTSGGTTDNFCTEWQGCAFKVVGGGAGRKLVCKGGIPDATCGGGVCGNGIVGGSEQCDDGNPDPTDGCTNDCTICGDGVVTPPEECDNGVNDGTICAPNCKLPGCGDGLVEPGETCDDGNTLDGDNCPSNCVIEACDANAGTDQTVTVSFAGSNDVAAIQVLLDYPEGEVVIPGTGDQIPFGIIDGFPNAFANTQSNDLDYALRQAYVDTAATPPGQLFQVHFETCAGAPVPTDGEFSCVVEAAGDVNAQEINGVTCSAHVEP